MPEEEAAVEGSLSSDVFFPFPFSFHDWVTSAEEKSVTPWEIKEARSSSGAEGRSKRSQAGAGSGDFPKNLQEASRAILAALSRADSVRFKVCWISGIMPADLEVGFRGSARWPNG